MCGRTACSLAADNLRRACAYRDRRGRQRQPEWVRQERYQPSYNKGPQSSGPVLLSRRHLQQDADSSERVLMDMRWGLVPSWFKQDNPSKLQFNTSNCRSDTMLSKSSYKGALLKGKRCVVLADGFYEWQQQSGGKQPYFIYFPQSKDATETDKETEGDEEWKGWRLLTMAGIFDCWEPSGGGEMLYTYTIITVDASKDVSFIHHRMPAILDGDEAIRKWLDFAEVPTQEAIKLIQPTENIVFHPVSTFVNNIRNNTPECVAAIELGAKKEVKATPSNKGMLGWLKKSQESSPQKKENDLPKWTSQFIQSPSPKKTSADVLQQWLGKQGQPPAKKHKA
ncbi:abasic site processing protein HMCES isoform X1 [Ammospiza nelsoni]|uniref:abasic site processing protein HMCES isoform X1 n=1 Tax=Ammospiza nelsoni TaxID=2857394 RepID=UPI002869E7C8|nr:abasic site processing protein HMCES isoform X1 [Ammospiza nelsoni]